MVRWPTLWRLATLLPALLGSGCGKQTPSTATSPSMSVGKNLHCAEAIWDLGEVDPTDPLKPIQHTFSLENRSGSEVVVKQVRANCGCLTPELDKKVIAAGETISLPVGLTLAPVPGPFARSVYIDVSEPEVETIELKVKGKVGLNAGLFSMPAQLDFGTVREGEPVLREIVVGRHDGSEVAFQSVSIDPGELALAEAPTPADAPNTLKLPLRFTIAGAGSTSERRDLFVTVQTDREAPFDVLKIRARATIVPRFSFVPSIFLTDLRDGETRQVPLLSTPASEPCPIREVRYEGDPRVTVQFGRVSAAHHPSSTDEKAGDADPASSEDVSTNPMLTLNVHSEPGSENRGLASGTILLSLEGLDEAIRIPVAVGTNPSPE